MKRGRMTASIRAKEYFENGGVGDMALSTLDVLINLAQDQPLTSRIFPNYQQSRPQHAEQFS